MQTGLGLYWWQRLFTFGSIKVKINNGKLHCTDKWKWFTFKAHSRENGKNNIRINIEKICRHNAQASDSPSLFSTGARAFTGSKTRFYTGDDLHVINVQKL